MLCRLIVLLRFITVHHVHTFVQGKENQPDGVADQLYNELPETSFTRSISNPEAVMRRRRQMKLEKKLEQFKSKDGGPDTGERTPSLL
jgi:hypothetical protein